MIQLPDLTGRRAVVTGANTGLGIVSAASLARAGADVVVTARDGTKGTAALERIHREQPEARLSLAHLDLADLGSVAAFAGEQLRSGPLDILMNNAGLMLVPQRQWTKDGFELQMGVNHLGHFALTSRLLPLLEQSTSGRVVSLSSLAHRITGPLDPRLGSVGSYDALGNYSQSKLACALFGFELDRRLKAAGSSVSSVVAHPGYCATELFSRQPQPGLVDRLTGAVALVVGSGPQHGVQSQLRAATDANLHGGELLGPRFLIRGGPVRERPASNARDLASASLLWDLSGAVTGAVFDL